MKETLYLLLSMVLVSNLLQAFLICHNEGTVWGLE